MKNIKEKFNNFFSNALNKEQQKAVEPKNGILLVCAGAGSGKTRVITSRMSNLIINHEVKSNSIIALTFTNKAANEMKERISSFLQGEYSVPYVGTFHSYCLRLLKSNPALLDQPNFSLLDEDDKLKIIKNLIQKNGLTKTVSPKQVISLISKIKNETISESEKEEFWTYNNIFKELYLMYEKEKKISHCLDFDDLLTHTLNIFKNNPVFKENFQKNIRHILVDEYQDTNKVQHALLKQMCINSKSEFALDSLCIVGDEDQSIYSWRGATVANIINFNKDFPQTASITIDQNYRSVQPILNLANGVIKNNQLRNEKKLWSEKVAHDRARLILCSSGFQEGEAIATFLKTSKNIGEKKSLNNNAILYRSHFQSRSIEEALIRHSIPYKIIGGIQFYDRMEIKDLLAYLKLIINPFERMAFSRVINTPSRGLGQKFEELFYNQWDQQPFLDFKAISKNIIDSKELTKTKEEELENFIEIFNKLTPQNLTSEAIKIILDKTGYYDYLKENYEKDEAQVKKENIKEFINGISYFESTTGKNLDSFLEEVSLLQDLMNSNEDTQEYVRLMTLHAAKGLEFDTVILTAIEDGIIPSTHSLLDPDGVEEERRLLYVGITRAKEHLLLTQAKYRYTFGQMTDQRPSRFVNELDKDFYEKQDCSFFKVDDFEAYFESWLDKKAKIKPEMSVFKPNLIEKKIKTNFYPEENSSNIIWRENQIVSHKVFGPGLIKKIENKVDSIYLTVSFKAGTKKIDSKFIDKL